MAYYAFLERLAVQIGANPAETGRIVAGAQVAGIIGGLLAAPVARRLGLVAGLCAVSILHAVTITLAVWTDTVFVLGAVAFFEAVLVHYNDTFDVEPWRRVLIQKDAGQPSPAAYSLSVLRSALLSARFSLKRRGMMPLHGCSGRRVLLAVSIFVLVSRSRTVKTLNTAG